MGAEDVVVDDHGIAWTGTEDGSVFRVGPDGAGRPVVGTPVAARWASSCYGEGRLLVADAHAGPARR